MFLSGGPEVESAPSFIQDVGRIRVLGTEVPVSLLAVSQETFSEAWLMPLPQSLKPAIAFQVLLMLHISPTPLLPHLSRFQPEKGLCF